jgi:hypothetical protein
MHFTDFMIIKFLVIVALAFIAGFLGYFRR